MSTGPDNVRVDQQDTTVRKTVASYSYQRSVYEVHQEFNQLDPQAIGDACRAWKRAADELLSLADGLKAQAAAPLSAAWTSPTSPRAQKQLQQAEATARALASDCLQMAHATDYAAQYAQWYKDNLPSYTDALASGAKGLVTGQGLTGGAEAAVQHLTNLLARYNEVIQTVPASVQSALVSSKSNVDMFHPPVQGGGGSVAGGAPHLGGASAPAVGGASSSVGGHHVTMPGGSGLTSGVSGGAGPGIGAGGGLGAGDPYAAGTSLAGTGFGGGVAGFDPNALGSGAASGVSGAGGLGGGLGAGLGAGALGATGLGAGGLAGGLGSGRAGAGLSGASGAGPLGGPGGALVGEEAAAGAGRGTGMMPMHGAGGQGEGEEERQRSTWLMEDDDVWGTGGDVPPPVITS